MELLILFAASVLTALLSLVGGVLLLGQSKFATFLNQIGKPFAALVLVYCVCFDLLPEVLEDGSLPVWEVFLLAVVGFVSCLLVQLLVGSLHRHGEAKELRSKTEAYSMLVIDSLHTVVDGIVLGVTFAASLGTGLLAAASTIAHEIPQEIGDFGIMLRSHISKPKILKLQVASALLLVPSALLAFFVGGALLPVLPPLLCLIAGFFLYIAFEEISAMIKESKEDSKETHHAHH